MAVHHALRIAGRAARVAHRHSRALVEIGVGEAGLLGAKQRVVVERGPERRGVAGALDDDVLHGRELVTDLGEQGDHGGIDDDHPVFGMVDHVGQLVGEQPDVQGVQHRPHARHGQVGLEMGLVVPHERADAVALFDAEAVEGRGELIGAVGDLGKRRLDVTVAGVRDDLAGGMHGSPMGEDRPERQRIVLHRAERHQSPCSRQSSHVTPANFPGPELRGPELPVQRTPRQLQPAAVRADMAVSNR